MKTRTFSSFLHSASEQVGRSWEGAQPGRQPQLACGNTPYCRWHAQLVNGGWTRGGGLSALLVSVSSNPLFSWSSNFSGSSGFFRTFEKFMKIHEFDVP